jgi:hypothetical protein
MDMEVCRRIVPASSDFQMLHPLRKVWDGCGLSPRGAYRRLNPAGTSKILNAPFSFVG